MKKALAGFLRVTKLRQKAIPSGFETLLPIYIQYLQSKLLKLFGFFINFSNAMTCGELES